jgi:hypothetical protein
MTVATAHAGAAAPLGPGADRALRAARPPRGGGDGPGVPGPVDGWAPGRGQDHQDRARRRGGVPRPVRARGGRGPAGQRGVHGGGYRGRLRGGHAVAGHGLRARTLAEPAGGRVRPAAGPGGQMARGRVRGGAGIDPRRRAGAPGPEAVQCACLAGRAPGDRLRGGQGRRAHPAHRHPRGRWHARLHGARAGTGHPAGDAGERRVLTRRDAGLRRHRARPLPGGNGHGRAGQARDRAARPVRAAPGTGRHRHRVPGPQPAPAARGGRAARPARAVRRDPGRAALGARLPARPGDGRHQRVPARSPAGRPRPGRRRCRRDHRPRPWRDRPRGRGQHR